MGDYLDDLVAQGMVDYLGHVLALDGFPAPELVRILTYFPLSPVENGCINYHAWPLIDGELSTTLPGTITATSFSRAYAGFLSNSFLEPGTGSSSELLRLSQIKNTSQVNTQTATQINGGGCVRSSGSAAAPCGYVPNYDFRWVTEISDQPLHFDVDVWRTNDQSAWQAFDGQTGGERLQATLTYRDFRLVFVTPMGLQDDKGWYSGEITEGMRDGDLNGIQFARFSSFGDVAGFVRAQVYVIVGRIQFTKKMGSPLGLSDLAAPRPTEKMLMSVEPSPLAVLPGLHLSDHLHVPFAMAVPGDPMENLTGLDTSWDTGDLYASLGAGYVLGAIKEGPLLT
ncbi:hypothetical protein RXV86_12485 [Alisedimentitalea sp. MJ-SS2]|uniref:hypothetical protein n=1 Tax=Aliisedimentitalea sp. MJ-SS2 TaxID=3049795 RepID=UPI0029134D3A|nr:hypothetical protein [Alisedimentitalea sp. MJ-SS2]MDU8928206.1 hypothetical protein [Alisedimentitalea sp. MJ-SS2]